MLTAITTSYPRLLGAAAAALGRLFADAREQTGSCAADALDAGEIAKLSSGDEETWMAFVDRHQSYVSAVMWRFVNSVEDLPDLVHDVFVEAYAGVGRFRPGSQVRPWLRGIGVHVGYRLWAAARRKRESGEMPLDAVAEVAARPESADPVQAKAALDSLLGGLSPRDRLVLTLLHVEQHSVAEIAALTGWSESMVKVQAFRARARLRKRLEQAGASQ